MVDISVAPIQSPQDLVVYVHDPLRGAPFYHLPAEKRAEFVETLRFTDAGLASLNFRILSENLSDSQAYELLTLFGWQSMVFSLP